MDNDYMHVISWFSAVSILITFKGWKIKTVLRIGLYRLEAVNFDVNYSTYHYHPRVADK